MQRTTNNIGEGDKSSVRVKQAPGGNSSISFGGPTEVEKSSTRVNQAPGGASSINFGGAPEPTTKVQSNAKYHNNSQISFGGYEDKPANTANTSVKVAQAPGGRSQIVFGGDDTGQQQQQKGGRGKVQNQEVQQQSVQAPVQQQQNTSVRVANPPGGKSSIQFG